MLRYAITSGRVGVGWDAKALVEQCATLSAKGIDFILVREKQLPAGELCALTRRVVELARGVRVLVSGRVDVAIAAGAAGVNLSSRAGELTVPQVRQLLPEAFVSVSCHSLSEVRTAKAQGADAVLFGPVFGKTVEGVEVVAGVGLERLREACREGVDVFALGGVKEANMKSCLEAGASGVASIRMFAHPR
jgi:thiamine-phosphate pyrophosphorylase